MATRTVCKYCGKPLVGRYITALGAEWHPEHFLCAGCHQPISDSSFNTHDGQPFHPQCYAEYAAPRCAYCHKPMTEHYVVSEGKLYHEDCYRNGVVPRCAYCHEPLMGEYLGDAWGAKFCKKHQQEYPACQFCGRLIPPSEQEAGKRDSIRCLVCRSRAIESMSMATPLFTELIRWAKTQLPGFPDVALKLELYDRAALARAMQGRAASLGDDPHMLGVTMSTTHTLDGREVGSEVNGIAVLRGLPTPLFQGVVAHELCHAWLVLQNIKGLPQWSEEGLCELLAHRYYMRLNTVESRHYAASIEKNPNPIYGDGFRRVRKVSDRLGFTQYVQLLRATKRLPDGS